MDRPSPADGDDTPGPGPGSFSAWFEGSSLSDVIGFGAAVGFLVSAPLMLALSLRVGPPRVTSVATPPRIQSPPAKAPRVRVGLGAVMDGVRQTASSSE